MGGAFGGGGFPVPVVAGGAIQTGLFGRVRLRHYVKSTPKYGRIWTRVELDLAKYHVEVILTALLTRPFNVNWRRGRQSPSCSDDHIHAILLVTPLFLSINVL